jgi:hypothetical protein
MEHLRKFETENEYLEAKDDFVYPNVSYVVEGDLVHYMSASNYEFVDLGLSVKWATCNVGATKPEESGLYFAWGEDKGYVVTKGNVQDEAYGVYTAVIKNADGTETTKTFAQDFSDYEHYEDGNFIKYTRTDRLTTLENEDDGCYLAEKTMRMPTKEECEELINGTTSAWTENYNESGVNGVVLTSNSNGNSIFVPAVGFVAVGELDGFGLSGGFWSSSLYSFNAEEAFNLGFYEDGLAVGNGGRFGGLPLRAVCP